jgi:hypothetical protein
MKVQTVASIYDIRYFAVEDRQLAVDPQPATPKAVH